MLSRTFSGDEEADDAAPATDAEEPKYEFDGFVIEVSQRIVLTPPAPAAAPPAPVAASKGRAH